MFEVERAKIATALATIQPAIEHIGSTSVPGLGAKPTIDIMIGVASATELDQTINPMIKAGFTYNSRYEDEIPERRLFSLLEAKLLTVIIPQRVTKDDKLGNIRDQFIPLANIHTVILDSPWWKRHIAFRDYLRTHPEAVEAYNNLKLNLAEQDWDDVNDYADAKTKFIRQIEQKANL
jgi:GrpB-like predicted nucleotidyltransferase (UPF0157 family)